MSYSHKVENLMNWEGDPNKSVGVGECFEKKISGDAY